MRLIAEKRKIQTDAGEMKIILLRPRDPQGPVPGILWIHGGGFFFGTAGIVHISQGRWLAERYGAVVISPEYRTSITAPYPAAFDDCRAALSYLYDHAEELGIDRNRIVVGGESAGGGLAVAVCLHARDEGRIPVCMQIPLYPMLDCNDTDSSRDNRGKGWNTRLNHFGWRQYLREMYGTDRVPKYASPARETDLAGMPPCYTYVQDGEPFHDETLTYINRLREAGVDATVDVFHGDIHCFDALFWTDNSKQASRRLYAAYKKYVVNAR